MRHLHGDSEYLHFLLIKCGFLQWVMCNFMSFSFGHQQWYLCQLQHHLLLLLFTCK